MMVMRFRNDDRQLEPVTLYVMEDSMAVFRGHFGGTMWNDLEPDELLTLEGEYACDEFMRRFRIPYRLKNMEEGETIHFYMTEGEYIDFK